MREKILTFIEKNSRIDLKELAIVLGVDETTVMNELEKMEEEHIICGYHTLIDWDKAPVKSASAIIELKVTPKKETGARSCYTVIWSRCSSGTISFPIFTNRYA